MQAALHRQQHVHILYDADQLQRPTLSWFEVDYWQHLRALEAIVGGRGGSFRIETPVGTAVLKHYLRGGQMARFSRDRYLFTGWERSRSLREWRLLAKLVRMGLPVPEPLAALCIQSGRRYQAALITRLIEHAMPLHVRLAECDEARAAGLLSATLHAIAELHVAGVYHPDVNFSNVLVDAADKIWLIDFDRAGILEIGSRRHRLAWPRMCARLLRSAHRLQQQTTLQSQHVLQLQRLLADL